MNISMSPEGADLLMTTTSENAVKKINTCLICGKAKPYQPHHYESAYEDSFKCKVIYL